MKIVRTGLLTAAMCWAASMAYGQQATEADQAAPQAAVQGQDANQQQDLQDGQLGNLEAQQDQSAQQRTQLEPPDQYGTAGQPGGQQHDPAMHSEQQRGAQGIAGGGQPGVLGVMIIESEGPGVVIREVVGGSAAEAAGLQPGDVILEINGEGVDSPPEVTQMIREIPAGQTATLSVWRDGGQQEIPATLQAAQRQPYRANFRGEDSAMGGDAAARIDRLESQLAAVMQVLQQLRQEVTQLRTARGDQPANINPPTAPGATQPGFEQLDATQRGLEQPGTQQPGLEEPATDATETDPALPF